MTEAAETNQVVPLPTAKREILTVMDPIPVMDTARFEHMMRVATAMAAGSLIPEALTHVGPKDAKTPLPYEQIRANCFLVVNQAVRWGMDPFAVAQCVSVVHGKLCYEGKLVAAALDAKAGIKLHHHFVGDPATEAYRIYLSDRPFTPELIARLKPGVSEPGWRLFDGSVAEWKTTGAGTPWTQKNYRRMLIYRGNRDWCRIYEPALMLGVYSDDEMLDLAENARSLRAAPVASTLLQKFAANGEPPGGGFSAEHVEAETSDHDPETGEVNEPATKVADDAPAIGPAASEASQKADVLKKDKAPHAAKGAGQQPSAATSSINSGADDFPGDRPAPREDEFEDPLKKARRLGRAARAAGQTIKDVPEAYRWNGREEEYEIWKAGFSERPLPPAGGE